MNRNIKSYRDLIVWQKSMDLVEEIYKVLEDFPKAELYGLTSQLKRSAVSIPSNISEGSRRGTKKDFKNFLIVAYGSGAELETQLEVSKRLNFINNRDYKGIVSLLEEVMKMLNKMIGNMNNL